jgi:hypothetical protein
MDQGRWEGDSPTAHTVVEGERDAGRIDGQRPRAPRPDCLAQCPARPPS